MTHRHRKMGAAGSLIAFAAVLGCGTQPAPQASMQRTRVDAVKVKTKTADVDDFCDVRHDRGSGPSWSWPVLEQDPPPPTAQWQWINIWATWCRPCVDELPMLAALRKRFAADALDLSLSFLSVDDSQEEVARFRLEHPQTPQTLRLRDAGQLPTWLTGLGLDAAASLPIHVFVDPKGNVRCVRMGGMSERDYEAVQALVKTSI